MRQFDVHCKSTLLSSGRSVAPNEEPIHPDAMMLSPTTPITVDGRFKMDGSHD